MCLNEVNNSWTLYGVLTAEGECLEESHPDVFASISSTREWITRGMDGLEKKLLKKTLLSILI